MGYFLPQNGDPGPVHTRGMLPESTKAACHLVEGVTFARRPDTVDGVVDLNRRKRGTVHAEDGTRDRRSGRRPDAFDLPRGDWSDARRDGVLHAALHSRHRRTGVRPVSPQLTVSIGLP